MATVLHGYARLTADIDLIVDLEESAAQSAMQALAGLGLRPRAPVDPADFADARIRESWLHDKGMQVFSLFHPDNPILSVDVFENHPIEFDGLHDRSETYDVGGVSVRVASIPDLIFLKRLADRPRDRDDIEQRRIHGEAQVLISGSSRRSFMDEGGVFVRSTTLSAVPRGEEVATLGLP